MPQATRRSKERLERLTVRFTREESLLLEKVRGLARGMGYKISDNAVFRLALKMLKPEGITPQAVLAVLAEDHRLKRLPR